MYNLFICYSFLFIVLCRCFVTATLHIIQMLCQKTVAAKMFFLSDFSKTRRTLVSVMLSICHIHKPRYNSYKKHMQSGKG